ncbi:MAG: restriction endonuclease subunit S [Muribaculum sp.]|nr:restriction endonuclease subunit S [Muribaculum sp.]
MKAYPEYKASGVDWIGTIPSHWACHKLKYHISISNGSDPKTEGDIPVYGAGELPFKTCGEYKDGPTVLLGRKGSVEIPHWVEGLYWNVDTAFDTKVKKDFSIRYFWYISNCLEINQYKSSTAVPSMTQSAYDNMLIPVPEIEEQILIAEYLDNVITKIDVLVAEKQVQIEDLRKYRTSLITEAVTNGLNPDVPRRQSGIALIGNIPEHWDLSKFKFSLREIKDGTHFSPDTTTDGYPYVTATDVRGIGINYEATKKVGREDFTKLVQSGCEIFKDDVLLVKDGATTGRVGMKVDDTPAVTLSSVAMLRTKADSIPKFFFYFLQSSIIQNQISIAMAGAAMPRITLEKLGNFIALIPPLDEQRQIAEYLDEKTAKIDALIDELTQQLDELALYRKAVISEAVTGKVDVRDWKPED